MIVIENILGRQKDMLKSYRTGTTKLDKLSDKMEIMINRHFVNNMS